MYTLNNGVVGTLQILDSLVTGQLFGYSVALNSAGTVLAVGAPTYNSAGRVYVYTSINGTWNLLLPIESGGGNSSFGNSVALNSAGTVLAVGAPTYSAGNNTGQVLVYNNSVWGSPVTINNSLGGAQFFGQSVALNSAGTVLAVGAPWYNTPSFYGRVYMYLYANGSWNSTPIQIIDTTAAVQQFGWSVALNSASSVLAVGANTYTTNVGRVYTYINVGRRQGNALAVNTNVWVAGGVSTINPLGYSSDGLTWVPCNNSTGSFPFSSGICNALAWNGGKFVAGGTGSNPLAYSYDGINWYSSASSGGMTVCNGLTWNGVYWLATGQGTGNVTLAYSQDGITWLGISNTLFSNGVGKAISSRRVLTASGGGAGGGGGGFVTQAQLNTQVATINANLATTNATVAANLLLGLGYNQVWTNRSSSYALNVTYTNNYSLNRPIFVSIGVYTNSSGVITNYFVNDVNIAQQYNLVNITMTYTFIVPYGSTYKVVITGTGSLNTWYELI